MADEKVIGLDKLSRFHDNLKSNGLPLNNWQANKKYKVGYTVIQDGKFYRCKTEHTSTTTFDNTKFDLVGGSSSGTTISDWDTGITYSVGDLVTHDNNIYQCNTNHTSTTFSTDESKWNLIGSKGIDFYTVGESYEVGDIVIYSGNIYQCTTAHTATSTFDTTKWTEISASITHIDDWVASTAYVQGDLVAHSAKIYRCITSHISESTWNSTEEGNWEELSPTYVLPVATTSMLGGVKSSSDEGKVTVLSDGTMQVNGGGGGGGGGIVDSAAAHNAIYRGENLTTYFDSGEMSEVIADGSFRNIYPGDYIIKSVTIDGTTYSDVKWIVMDLDYHLHAGDTETITHHVVLMPETTLGTHRMNETNSIIGGFYSSEMYSVHIPKVAAGIKVAFGADHVLKHREYLSNAVDTGVKPCGYNGWTGAASSQMWVNVDVNLCNEPMVCGFRNMSSSQFDVGECIKQLAAFDLNHGLRCSKRQSWWLRAVTTSNTFAYVYNNGFVYYNLVFDDAGGVRPYFLLY